MTDTHPPLLAAVFPELAAEITELLRADDDHALADTVAGLPYLGRCDCSPTCTNLLTAPRGSSGPYLAQLERDDEVVIWLSLTPDVSGITDIEILDGRGELR
ncbi:hypothetical protein ACWEQL_05960 [Kitasatospora sp. NPDC004240]